MKQEDLVVGKEYYIIRTGQFCSYTHLTMNVEFSEGRYKFIGKINIGIPDSRKNDRNIFYKNGYLMMGCDDLNYIVDEKFLKIKKFLEESGVTEEELKSFLK
jgi:hypothetical protein